MAPAAIQTGSPPQQQWKRIFLSTWDFYSPAPNGEVGAVPACSGVVQVYDFGLQAKTFLYGKIPVPTDWIAGTDAYIYPVWSMSTNTLGKVRWGIEYVAQVKNQSIAAVAIVAEGSMDADGTGVVLPPKPQWLTLDGHLWGGEPVFQRDDFTQLAHIEFKWYRDALSALDTHVGTARLYGLVVMYQTFI